MPQVQLDDLPVTGAEPGERRARRRAELRPLGVRGQVDRLVGQLVRRAGLGGQRAGTQAVAAFVARHGIEPGPEPAGIAQPVQLGGGDDEGVLDRGVGVGRLAQQAAAVGMQSGRIPVVDGRQSVPPALSKRRHHLSVPHAPRVSPVRHFTERLIGTN
jgi:hypothetical protein